MLIQLIRTVVLRTSLRGVDGVGVVHRGTVEEDVWSELGIVPGNRRFGRIGKPAGDKYEHRRHTEETKAKPRPSRAPAITE